MAKKLYVGNLPFNVRSENLQQAFEAHGEVVSAKVITDPEGRSKGFGFVEMASDESAQSAITALNKSELGGRTIMVSEARAKEEGGGSGGGRPPYRGGQGGGGGYGGGGGGYGGDRRGGGGGGDRRGGGGGGRRDRG